MADVAKKEGQSELVNRLAEQAKNAKAAIFRAGKAREAHDEAKEAAIVELSGILKTRRLLALSRKKNRT